MKLLQVAYKYSMAINNNTNNNDYYHHLYLVN